MLGSLLTPLIVQGAVYLVNLAAADLSKMIVAFLCYYKYVAGTSLDTCSSQALLIISALFSE